MLSSSAGRNGGDKLPSLSRPRQFFYRGVGELIYSGDAPLSGGCSLSDAYSARSPGDWSPHPGPTRPLGGMDPLAFYGAGEAARSAAITQQTSVTAT